MQKTLSSSAFSDSKPHYELLDGLRGVAALLVIWYHVFEAFATSPIDQKFNHGYLAVDFFFILSGFVIGYAYDDRWKMTMTVKDFVKRRLIRLHPMVVMGAILGACTFYIQGSEKWDGSQVSLSVLMLAMLLNLFLIPAIPGSKVEVRGNGEMYPLNGPSWSLFFEYIGNILYALFIRRLSTKSLALLVSLSGIGLAAFAISGLSGYGHLGVGWTLLDYNLIGGFLRLMFSFSAGLLMSRVFKPVKIRGAFWICSIILLGLFSVPYLEGTDPICINGLYESFCIIIVFPILIWLGASGTTTDIKSTKICKFLGDISFPLYIIHYPFMYLFYAWLIDKQLFTLGETRQMVLGVLVINIVVAYLCLKLYDEPVRKWLSKKFLAKK